MIRKKEQYKFPCPFCGSNTFGFARASVEKKSLGEKLNKLQIQSRWTCLNCRNFFTESRDYEGEYNRLYPLAKESAKEFGFNG